MAKKLQPQNTGINGIGICIPIFLVYSKLISVDSSGSATQLHYLTRLKSVPTPNNRFHQQQGITRMQSSQKTTKTCAV
ncbi:unnamed protein product [Brassicogethes aeneus]|uniref:Uncharacterized protein n=1 Tax=Brassicogethes aeneus TaxID=1431903 RepID=A0A9P0AXM4_BRAAE|nr:unnamed protein product [Brassicogethes aeneus]